jgi:tripartite-type tricarboxylate transporter receptor subunit TctC
MSMRKPNLGAAAAALALLACALCAPAQAQTFPSKTIRIVVPYAPGGGNDVLGRMFAAQMSASLGQPVIVDNRAGAGGNIGTEYVAHAAPDGYTLLYVSNSLSIAPSLYGKLNFSLQELAPVSLVASFPIAIVAHASVPAKNIKELVELSKKRGGLSFGSVGTGSANHLTGVLLDKVAGTSNLHVPYKGAGPMMTALLGGETDFAVANVFTAQPYAGSDKLRILAVTGPKPSAALPGIPTVASDFPGFDTGVWHGFLTAAGTPPAVLAILNREVLKALHTPQIREALEKGGGELVGNTPAEFAAIIDQETKKYATLVKLSGAKAD